VEAAGVHSSEDDYRRSADAIDQGQKTQGGIVTNEEYSRLALRTAPDASIEKTDDAEPMVITKGQYRMLLGIIGLLGEAGEIAEAIKKHIFHGHELDLDKLKKELGDVSWYHNHLTVRTAKTSLEAVQEANIAKLAARYPEGFFSSERSINRAAGDE
jgi:NTP pyrophosphatase (non-canonical NTP hydrolase)